MRYVVLLAFACAACGDAATDPEANDAAVAAVERANNAAPPMVQVVPETLGYPDIEANDIFGQSCAYAPGTSLGARVIAREADAFMKVDGQVLRFAADPGSRELPMRTRSSYNGQTYSLRLAIEEPAIVDSEEQAGLMEGTIFLRDRWDRVVYQGTGAVSCSS